MITQETVNYISALARLHLEPSEVGKFAGDLEAILGYVDQLKAVDVTGVLPTSHVLKVENVFREDKVIPGLTQSQAMAFAVENAGGAYKVPRVIE
jgi:aspartyl-tRNA(Asn)/glutamyl-tRNA(Gln) amidotransferase subunit C